MITINEKSTTKIKNFLKATKPFLGFFTIKIRNENDCKEIIFIVDQKYQLIISEGVDFCDFQNTAEFSLNYKIFLTIMDVSSKLTINYIGVTTVSINNNTINTCDHDSFSEMIYSKENSSLFTDIDIKMFKNISIFTKKDEYRPTFEFIYYNRNDNEFIATDSNRLVLIKNKNELKEFGEKRPKEILIWADVIDFAGKIYNKNSKIKSLEIYYDNIEDDGYHHTYYVVNKELTFHTKLDPVLIKFNDVKFPNYSHVIDREIKDKYDKLVINSNGIKKLLSETKPFAKKSKSLNSLVFNMKNQTIKVEIRETPNDDPYVTKKLLVSNLLVRGEQSLNVDEIYFNVKLLIDSLKAYLEITKTDELELNFNINKNLMQITNKYNSDLAIVMPVYMNGKGIR